MEISLARQGNRVWLSAEDFADSYQKLTGRSLEQGFMFQEIVHIIDFVGVKVKKSKRRYVARSTPLTNLAEVPGTTRAGTSCAGGNEGTEFLVQGAYYEDGILGLPYEGSVCWRGDRNGARLGSSVTELESAVSMV